MQYIKRAFFYGILTVFINSVLFCYAVPLHVLLKILILFLLTGTFVYYNISPSAGKFSAKKHKALFSGHELLLASGFFFVLQTGLYVYFAAIRYDHVLILIINGIVSLLLAFLLALNGLIRVFAVSRQLSKLFRVILLLFWWMPVVNIVLLSIACVTVLTEYKFLVKKYRLNEGRKEKKVCQTKYPILMIHGIFFRDWKLFNYWGRIPKELTDNGAAIFYGNHNSSLPAEKTAETLKQRILDIVKETGCEKVNIIAHSKGGMEARYVISCLDMDPYVASLTTINTPHKGTPLAGGAIEKIPKKVFSTVGKGYKGLYTKLGDENCDFLAGVNELTPEKCAELNEKIPDCEGVYYQSAGSKMKSSSGAMFPLNAGYAMIKPSGGENDGLVPTDSMVWGHFSGVLQSSGKKGISHGDMIDLTRKNIPGFDVCEFYVGLVSGLKEKGL